MTLTIDEVWTLAKQAGFTGRDLVTAVLIAYAESRFDPDQVTPEPFGGPSYGLWQIHASAWPNFAKSRLLEPEYNAQCAFRIRSDVGFSAWSTWSPRSAYDPNYYEQFRRRFQADIDRLEGVKQMANLGLAASANAAIFDENLDPDNAADPGVYRRGMCSKFVRCTVANWSGSRNYHNHFGATAIDTWYGFYHAGLGQYQQNNNDVNIGDILVGIEGHGPYGHIVIYVGDVPGVGSDLVAENSSAHPDSYHTDPGGKNVYTGAKGWRPLADAGAYQGRIRLPSLAQVVKIETRNLYLNGQRVAVMPVVNDTSLCPVRKFAGWLGMELGLDGNTALLDGVPVPGELQIRDGIGYLPIRSLAETTGLHVTVDSDGAVKLTPSV